MGTGIYEQKGSPLIKNVHQSFDMWIYLYMCVFSCTTIWYQKFGL